MKTILILALIGVVLLINGCVSNKGYTVSADWYIKDCKQSEIGIITDFSVDISAGFWGSRRECKIDVGNRSYQLHDTQCMELEVGKCLFIHTAWNNYDNTAYYIKTCCEND